MRLVHHIVTEFGTCLDITSTGAWSCALITQGAYPKAIYTKRTQEAAKVQLKLIAFYKKVYKEKHKNCSNKM